MPSLNTVVSLLELAIVLIEDLMETYYFDIVQIVEAFSVFCEELGRNETSSLLFLRWENISGNF